MPVHYGKFVAYFRVSTDRQGKSGLGLEAQRKSVLDYLDGGRWTLIAEFTEIESGKRNDRPELGKALAACKKQKAKLVIAKLDRLSRNLAFIAALMDSGVEFTAVDNPHANKLTIHILAAVEQERDQVVQSRSESYLRKAEWAQQQAEISLNPQEKILLLEIERSFRRLAEIEAWQNAIDLDKRQCDRPFA